MNEYSLTDKEWQTLESLANRIIPGDDYPGAWSAGVGDFLATLFKLMPDFLDQYRSGLSGVELESETVFGRRFADLNEREQDRLLAAIESGSVLARWVTEPTVFFALLVDQVMEGYYADPGNGGNKDRIAWTMIGFKVTA